MAYKRGKPCAPCQPFEELEVPDGKAPGDEKGKCPETLEQMCKEVNDKFEEWKKWGVGVNDTLNIFAKAIWRLEHAVCCLEGHVIYGHARPRRGLICNRKGNWRPGTFHDEVLTPWPITNPPDEPWEA